MIKKYIKKQLNINQLIYHQNQENEEDGDMMNIKFLIKDSTLEIPIQSSDLECLKANLKEAVITISKSSYLLIFSENSTKVVSLPLHNNQDYIIDDILVADDISEDFKEVKTLFVEGFITDLEIYM